MKQLEHVLLAVIIFLGLLTQPHSPLLPPQCAERLVLSQVTEPVIILPQLWPQLHLTPMVQPDPPFLPQLCPQFHLTPTAQPDPPIPPSGLFTAPLGIDHVDGPARSHGILTAVCSPTPP